MAYTKVIQSGDLVEQWEYEREPNPERLVRRKPRIKRSFSMERRLDNIIKTKSSFRRLVRANLVLNAPPALLTLTMMDIVPINEAYKEFTRFMHEIRRLHKHVQWIAVPEFQKRGAVHFHALMFQLPHEIVKNERRTRYLAHHWGQGFVDIKRTDGSAKLSGYLAKYMSKAMHDKRLLSKRGYTSSRGVRRPVTLSTSFQRITAMAAWGLGVDKLPVQQREYATIHLGRCVYKQFIVENIT